MSIDPETKVVIFCGGQGTRLKDIAENMPKPLVPIGNKPILWHIMKIYASQGIRNFVLCLGYKGDSIRDFFLNYKNYVSDITINLKEDSVTHARSNSEDWNVTLVNTGEETNTAKRLYLVRRYIEHDPYFMVTYGDGVSDIDIEKLFEFHKKIGKTGTITGVNPSSKYGEVKTDDSNVITSFMEKPVLKNSFINGGFMVFNYDFLSNPLLKEDIPLEVVLEKLVNYREIALYRHFGFWHCMDTPRDYNSLNEIWKTNNAPWKIW